MERLEQEIACSRRQEADHVRIHQHLVAFGRTERGNLGEVAESHQGLDLGNVSDCRDGIAWRKAYPEETWQVQRRIEGRHNLVELVGMQKQVRQKQEKSRTDQLVDGPCPT